MLLKVLNGYSCFLRITLPNVSLQSLLSYQLNKSQWTPVNKQPTFRTRKLFINETQSKPLSWLLSPALSEISLASARVSSRAECLSSLFCALAGRTRVRTAEFLRFQLLLNSIGIGSFSSSCCCWDSGEGRQLPAADASVTLIMSNRLVRSAVAIAHECNHNNSANDEGQRANKF